MNGVYAARGDRFHRNPDAEFRETGVTVERAEAGARGWVGNGPSG